MLKLTQDDFSNFVDEERGLIGVNKPAGMLVHPTHKGEKGTLCQIVSDRISRRATLVHRLDRDTSGAMFMSANSDTTRRISIAIQNRTGIEKKYLAIVTGKVPAESGIIQDRIKVPNNGKKCRISQQGKESETHYSVKAQAQFTIDGVQMLLSFMEFDLKTGRRHQIRLHAANAGFPIIGDSLYGDNHRNYLVRKRFGLQRQALHAHKYTWDDQVSGKVHKVIAHTHQDMQRIVDEIY